MAENNPIIALGIEATCPRCGRRNRVAAFNVSPHLLAPYVSGGGEIRLPATLEVEGKVVTIRCSECTNDDEQPKSTPKSVRRKAVRGVREQDRPSDN